MISTVRDSREIHDVWYGSRNRQISREGGRAEVERWTGGSCPHKSWMTHFRPRPSDVIRTVGQRRCLRRPGRFLGSWLVQWREELHQSSYGPLVPFILRTVPPANSFRLLRRDLLGPLLVTRLRPSSDHVNSNSCHPDLPGVPCRWEVLHPSS